MARLTPRNGEPRRSHLRRIEYVWRITLPNEEAWTKVSGAIMHGELRKLEYASNQDLFYFLGKAFGYHLDVLEGFITLFLKDVNTSTCGVVIHRGMFYRIKRKDSSFGSPHHIPSVPEPPAPF